MAHVSKDMTFGELLMTYYEKCPKIVDDLMESRNGLHRMPSFTDGVHRARSDGAWCGSGSVGCEA